MVPDEVYQDDPGVDVVDQLVEQHHAIERLFTSLERRPRHDRQHLIELTIIELVRHNIVEEHYLYPLARDVLDNGHALVEDELAWHTGWHGDLEQLEQLAPDTVDAELILQALTATVRGHIQRHEEGLFLALKQTCTRQRRRDIGSTVREVRHRTVTRAVLTPPATCSTRKSTPPLTGLVDRTRAGLLHPTPLVTGDTVNKKPA